MMKNNKDNRSAEMKAAGINTDKFFSIQLPEGLKPGSSLSIIINDNGEPVFCPCEPEYDIHEDETLNQIISDGYVRNTKIHRRWIMAQMFKMINYKNRYESGFYACLRDRYSYMYQFDMMLDEVKVLSKLEERDLTALSERSHFFSLDVVKSICKEYINDLEKYIDKLKVHKCKGIPYKKIDGMNIFVSDIQRTVISPLKNILWRIQDSKNYKTLYINLRSFRNKMKDLPYDTKKIKAWVDAFIGAGSYYTLMNMVKFHKCFIINYDNNKLKYYRTNAVDYLNLMLEKYKGEYYRMFALLKKTIDDNEFDLVESINDSKVH